MTDITDHPPFEVDKTAIGLQFKAQVRVWVAALAGALVTAAANKLKLPILTTLWGVQGDQVVGVVTGAVLLASMSGWQWARVRLSNSRWWKLAINPRVPNDLVRVRPAPIDYSKGV